METVTDFILGGSKITADGDCSHKLKRRLLLGRRAITKLHSILESKDITLPTKVHIVKALVFLVRMWELNHKEGWTLKNWYFWTMMLKKTFKSLLDSKIKPVNPKGNQSWIFIGRSDAGAEAPILWLPGTKSQLIWKSPWCWERLRAGGEGDDRGWDGWMAPLTQWTWIWASSGRCWRTGRPVVLQSMGWQKVRHNLTTEQGYLEDFTIKYISAFLSIRHCINGK